MTRLRPRHLALLLVVLTLPLVLFLVLSQVEGLEDLDLFEDLDLE